MGFEFVTMQEDNELITQFFMNEVLQFRLQILKKTKFDME